MIVFAAQGFRSFADFRSVSPGCTAQATENRRAPSAAAASPKAQPRVLGSNLMASSPFGMVSACSDWHRPGGPAGLLFVLESTYTPRDHPKSTPLLREVIGADGRSIRPGSAGKSHHRRDPRHGISEIWPGPYNPEPRYGPYIRGMRRTPMAALKIRQIAKGAGVSV